MFSILLTLHSLVRWLVLISLLTTIFKAYYGWRNGESFSRNDHFLRSATVIIIHTQLLLGVSLYFISPIVSYFWSHFKEAVHQREIRFFGMEHIFMMVIAITVLTIGSAKVKRKEGDKEKFKTMFIWFTVALLLIFSSIPWKFLPFTARPYFRPF